MQLISNLYVKAFCNFNSFQKEKTMNLKKIFFVSIIAFVLVFSGIEVVNAQTSKNKSNHIYLVKTFTINASKKDRGSTKISREISKTISDLKKNYDFSSYSVFSENLQMIGRNGNINYQEIGFDSKDSSNPVFASWSLLRLRELKDSQEKDMVEFNSFQFNLSLPFKFSNVRDRKTGLTGSFVEYRPLRLSLQNMRVPLNEPTVFGSLPIKSKDEALFFIAKIERVG